MPSSKKHLVVVISGHGYGHAAMTAPLINAIQDKYPQLKVTLRSNVPLNILQCKFKYPFDYLADSTDFGMIMHNAFTIDKDKSLRQYQDHHQDWQAKVNTEIDHLKQLQADLLISNIAYLPLLAARQAGVPGIAYSCLNWAEIFQHYFPERKQIYQQMMLAYSSADHIIKSEPCMPMIGLRASVVGPVCEIGQNDREQLLNSLNLPINTKLILSSMGGIKTNVQPGNWPSLEGVHYLISNTPPSNRNDISSLSTSNISFSDALCSCDILFTKPGYGSFTEAAMNRKAVLYVERPDWPESVYLCDWLVRYSPCCSISQAQFDNGNFSQELASLLQRSQPLNSPQSGLSEAIDIIGQYL